jgi:hypothetical protein
MITITSTESAKIYFKGTSIEITDVLARLEFTAPSSGKTLQAALYIYENLAAFKANPNNLMKVEGFDSSAKTYDLSNDDDPLTYKEQTISVAHDEVKAYLEGLGFTAVISGI